MILDCFTFFNEFDILEIRLHEMDPWVDYFVLVESAETFSGNPKPLWFAENRESRFNPFLPKIIHVISPTIRGLENAWARQEIQRNYAIKALSPCCNDLVLIGDVDEIVRGANFAEIQNNRKAMTTFHQKNYFYYMNLLRGGGWPGTVMMPYGTLKSDYGGSLWEARRLRRKGKRIKNSGWHFSNMGGMDAIRLKLKASCHHDTPSYKKMIEDNDFLYDLMDGERTIKRRKMRVVPIDDSYPVWFKENVGRFKHLLTKEVTDASENK